MFSKLEYDLLECENLSSCEKILIAFFTGYEQSNSAFFGGVTYLARVLGASFGEIEKNLEMLEEKGILENNIYEIRLKMNIKEIVRKFRYIEGEI